MRRAAWTRAAILVILSALIAVASAQTQPQCLADQFMRTRVNNPPYAMRTFTSRNTGTGVLHLLPWRPTTYNNAQYMQIDLSQQLTVLGIRTQIAGSLDSQYVATFKLQHAGLLEASRF